MNFGTKRLLQGIGVGFLATLSSPSILPIAAAILRPLVKSLPKQGFLVVEAGREHVAQALEGLEDTLTEVRAVVDHELSQRKPRSHGRGSESPEKVGSAAKPDAIVGFARDRRLFDLQSEPEPPHSELLKVRGMGMV